MTSGGAPDGGEELARELIDRSADDFERRTGAQIDTEVRAHLAEAVLANAPFVRTLTGDEDARRTLTDAASAVFAQAAQVATVQREELAFAGPGEDASALVVGTTALFRIKLPWPFGPA